MVRNSMVLTSNGLRLLVVTPDFGVIYDRTLTLPEVVQGSVACLTAHWTYYAAISAASPIGSN